MPQIAFGEFSDIGAADADAAGGGFINAVQKIGEGTFAAACGAENTKSAALGEGKGYIVENFMLAVGKTDALKNYVAAKAFAEGVGIILFRLGKEYFIYALGGNPGLA